MNRIILYSILALGILVSAVSGASAAGDPDKGKKLARKCAVCHTLDSGGKNGLGPNLYGIYGKAAGKADGYRYSKAMASSGVIWDDTAFTEFLTKPKAFVKGTKMGFSGLRNAQDRADILAYFKTLRELSHDIKVEGDVTNGKIVAEKQCVVCHSFEKGGKVVFGPNLFGSYGRAAGAVKDYAYSKALAGSGLIWTDANLVEFLGDPQGFLPGTKAKFPGVKNAKDRADVVEYLKTFR